MGRNCFILNCKGNKDRYRTDESRKLPAYFRFPKSADLFEKWKSVVPPRTYKSIPNRYPTDKDYLCSLHFKEEDVIKYYEISSIKGCPQSEVVKIERGTWTLKPDAVPCFFSDDNPDAKGMTHKRRLTNHGKGKVGHKYAKKCDEGEEFVDEEGLSSGEETQTREAVTSKLPNDGTDHDYHLRSNKSKGDIGTAVTELIKTTIADFEKHPSPNDNDSSSNQCDSVPYSIEQLHQDVLEIALPKNWTFFQNDDDLSTQFNLYYKKKSVKCVKFLGSCIPLVTVNNSVLDYKRINSKQDIVELLDYVNTL